MPMPIDTEPAIDPPPMPRGMRLAYAVGIPAALLVLLFLPAGSLAWQPGWVFLAVLILAFAAAAFAIARLNPVIFRARSRFQPGTAAWDRRLLAIILPAMVAILPVAAVDAGRFHWSAMPLPFVLAGYAALLASIAGTAWAQAVNPYFEPGVRIQSERRQHVVQTGPYAVVRHPGYVAALLLFAGMALALGSWWALVPGALASAILVLRTSWEDQLLRAELPFYRDYADRVRWRLVPGLW